MSGGEEDIAVRQYPQIIGIGRFVLPHHLVVFHHKYDSLRIIGSGKRLGLCKQRRGREKKKKKRLKNGNTNKKEYPKLELTKKSVLSQISSFPKEENVDTTDFLVTPQLKLVLIFNIVLLKDNIDSLQRQYVFFQFFQLPIFMTGAAIR